MKISGSARLSTGLVVACALLLAFGASAANAARTRCVGSPEAPGVLSGEYPGNVVIEGPCMVDAGPVLVRGHLSLRPGSALVAAFALDHTGGSHPSNVTVFGKVKVDEGATLLLGCEPKHFPCLDDPEGSSSGLIHGRLEGQQPLGMIVHNSVVRGPVREIGGGGGATCEPSGIFAAFESPVYSDFEDTVISGNVNITGLSSCWLGLARLHVFGNVRVERDQLADPDAIEVVSNLIEGDLSCHGDSHVWDSGDLSPEGLFPREPQPNTVSGARFGDCVLASPESEGGPSGPALF